MSTTLMLLFRLLGLLVTCSIFGWWILMGVGTMSPTTNPNVERARAFAGTATGIGYQPGYQPSADDKAEESQSDRNWRYDSQGTQTTSRPATPGRGSTAPMVDLSRYDN